MGGEGAGWGCWGLGCFKRSKLEARDTKGQLRCGGGL